MPWALVEVRTGRTPEEDTAILDAVHEALVTDCIAGRSVDAKRRLHAEIAGGLEPLGLPADHVSINLRESPLEDWGVRGGQAACEVDLGFEVSV